MHKQNKEVAPKKFTFELEKELMTKPDRRKELLSKVDAHVQTIKQTLRTGQTGQEFDQLGVLLKGYAALHKVLAKIPAK